jgi:hypothetical protein
MTPLRSFPSRGVLSRPRQSLVDIAVLAAAALTCPTTPPARCYGGASHRRHHRPCRKWTFVKHQPLTIGAHRGH